VNDNVWEEDCRQNGCRDDAKRNQSLSDKYSVDAIYSLLWFIRLVHDTFTASSVKEAVDDYFAGIS